MRTFEYVCVYIAPSCLANFVLFCRNGEKKKDFKCVFTVIFKDCQLRFSHNYTVLSLMVTKSKFSCFMPRHQTLSFSYTFKAKRYNVNLVNNNQSQPKHLGVFICD